MTDDDMWHAVQGTPPHQNYYAAYICILQCILTIFTTDNLHECGNDLMRVAFGVHILISQKAKDY